MQPETLLEGPMLGGERRAEVLFSRLLGEKRALLYTRKKFTLNGDSFLRLRCRVGVQPGGKLGKAQVVPELEFGALQELHFVVTFNGAFNGTRRRMPSIVKSITSAFARLRKSFVDIL